MLTIVIYGEGTKFHVLLQIIYCIHTIDIDSVIKVDDTMGNNKHSQEVYLLSLRGE